jgi:hypothetical protein
MNDLPPTSARSRPIGLPHPSESTSDTAASSGAAGRRSRVPLFAKSVQWALITPMEGRLYVTAEDDELHRSAGGALLLCGKVLVGSASEHDLSTRGRCVDCERAARALKSD